MLDAHRCHRNGGERNSEIIYYVYIINSKMHLILHFDAVKSATSYNMVRPSCAQGRAVTACTCASKLKEQVSEAWKKYGRQW